MEASSKKKIVLGVLVPIVLGAIGSGIWEGVFSPFVTWLARSTLTLATLGLDSVSDSIYVDVAKGHHEYASLIVYSVIATMYLLAPLVLALEPWRRRKARETLEGGTGVEQIEYLRNRIRRLKRISLYLLMILTLLSTVVFVRFLMQSYTNTAITYFNQSLTIVLPYVSPEEERRLRSEFARISNKRDFEQLVQKLNERAVSNDVQLPEFSIW